jgi:hypothetical protein
VIGKNLYPRQVMGKGTGCILRNGDGDGDGMAIPDGDVPVAIFKTNDRQSLGRLSDGSINL